VRERVWVSRVFWQAFSALGALVLASVLWSAFFPESLGFLSALPGAGNRTRESDGGAGRTHAVTITAAAPASAAGGAQLRVRVAPEGQVWVDGELRGAATPVLELALPPGEHVVAVGRDAPLESRRLVLRAGQSEQSFDLSAR
jgi:hypothetical protein